MSIVSDLLGRLTPYISRGDSFADELHRLLTIIEEDAKAVAGGAGTVPSTQEPVSREGQVTPAPDQEGQAVQPAAPVVPADTANPDPGVQDVAQGGSGGTVPVEPAQGQGQA